MPPWIRSSPRLWLLGGLAAVVVALGVVVLALRSDDDERVLVEAPESTSTTEATTTTDVSTTDVSTTAEVPSTGTVPSTAAPVPGPSTAALTPSLATPNGPASPGAPTTTAAPTSSPPPPRPPAPPFQSSIQPITAEQLGASWQPGMGCPAPDQLRLLVLSHWGYDGRVHEGRLVVAASHAERIVAVFRDIYAARFPIQKMVPIDAYGGNDQASMRDNNTSGFNCRFVAGTSRLSQHGLGQAIDVNPLMNPYVKDGTVDPPEGAPYADRRRNDQGMIKSGDAVVTAFARQGWPWGGNWSSGKDYQHFSATGR